MIPHESSVSEIKSVVGFFLVRVTSL